jgi:hypothetical protein
MLSERESVRTFVWAAVLSLAAGLLYFLTAGRDIVVGDTPELITAAVTLGVAHPPGYPLFTMLGHLFSLLPIGPLPFRVNLLSVVCDALTVGVVFLTAFRLSRSRIASAIAALTLALNPTFWSWSLVAEVFPLNNLLGAILIYLLVIWHDSPERTGFLVGASFVTGLAFANHHTIVLLLPAVALVCWQCRAALWARPQVIVFCLIAFIVGLLPYGYVLWAAARHPSYNWSDVSSIGDLFGFITRQNYGTHDLVAAPYRGGSALPRIMALCFSFGAPLGLVALLGVVRAYRNCRWYFWFSLLAFAFTGLLFAIISNFNLASVDASLSVLERFFLLPEFVAAPLVALGVVLIRDAIASSAPEFPGQPLTWVAGALALVLIVSLLSNYRRIDQSHNHIARTFGEDVFASVEPGTILFAAGDPFAIPLLYLNVTERTRRDVTFIISPLLTSRWYLGQLRERYPDLKIPFDAYDGRRNNFKMLIEANREKPIAVVGPLPDPSVKQDYWPHPHGLVNLIEPNLKWIPINEIASENELMMKRYRPPSTSRINRKTFETGILFLYSYAAWQIGANYEREGAKAEARAWYQRALAIDPGSRSSFQRAIVSRPF